MADTAATITTTRATLQVGNKLIGIHIGYGRYEFFFYWGGRVAFLECGDFFVQGEGRFSRIAIDR